MTAKGATAGEGVGHRILVKRPGLYRTLRRDDKTAYLYDPTSLNPLLEEAIATGATGFAFTATSPAREQIDLLPAVLRKRVELVNLDGSVSASARGLLGPVAQDLNWQFLDNGALKTPNDLPDEMKDAIAAMFPALFDFLLGSKHRLQVSIDRGGFQSAVTLIRAQCRSPEARLRLAQIEGVLNTYSEHKFPALAFRSTATADQINVFTDLVEDATYVELSKNTGLLGSPADGDHNFALIQRLVRTLSDKPLFKPVVFVAEKALQLGTHIPLPVGKLLEWLLPRPYLPLIVPLEAAYSKAEQQWMLERPPLEAIPDGERLLSEGWVELQYAPQPTDRDFQAVPDSDYLLSKGGSEPST